MNAFLNSSVSDDSRLVERHLAGDGSAFREIVERHQGMVCALAYSACGDVARSEDVAQEVFVAAWRQLPALRSVVPSPAPPGAGDAAGDAFSFGYHGTTGR